MFSIKQWFQILLVLSVVLLGPAGLAVQAEGVEGSVKDSYEKPDKPAADEPESAEETTSSGSTELSFWDFARMLSATIFVVALLYIALRFINKKSRSYQKANFIENIGGASLGSNRSVQLIKVGNSILVVGVGETIQLLKEIDNEEEYGELLQNYNEKMEHMIQPGDLITKLKQKLSIADTKPAGFASQFKKQLEELSKDRKKVIKKLDEEERD